MITEKKCYQRLLNNLPVVELHVMLHLLLNLIIKSGPYPKCFLGTPLFQMVVGFFVAAIIIGRERGFNFQRLRAL